MNGRQAGRPKRSPAFPKKPGFWARIFPNDGVPAAAPFDYNHFPTL